MTQTYIYNLLRLPSCSEKYVKLDGESDDKVDCLRNFSHNQMYNFYYLYNVCFLKYARKHVFYISNLPVTTDISMPMMLLHIGCMSSEDLEIPKILLGTPNIGRCYSACSNTPFIGIQRKEV
jgi:hypothetical protein